MRRSLLVWVTLNCFGSPAPAQSAAPPTRGLPSHLVLVRMVERLPYGIAFEPIRVTVQQGDTVRFVQTGRMPHNVEFRSAPAAADLGRSRSGPTLVSVGQTYDVVIDAAFPPGKYFYVCTPHEVMGMAGIIYVAAGAR